MTNSKLLQDVFKSVAETTRIPYAVLIGKERNREITEARDIAIAFLRIDCQVKHDEIKSFLNKKFKSTITQSSIRHYDLIRFNEPYKKKCEECFQKLKNVLHENAI